MEGLRHRRNPETGLWYCLYSAEAVKEGWAKMDGRSWEWAHRRPRAVLASDQARLTASHYSTRSMR